MSLCNIYKSSKKAYTYLYLRHDLELDDLPPQLRELMGDAELTMEVDLAERTTLAKEDIDVVRSSLEDPGYHLQLPPEDDPSGWLDLPKRGG